MSISFASHFTYKKLLRITLPSVIMLVFTSIYGVVDGFFVSNFVGKESFSAVNFIIPYLMILGSLGFMFGTGGGALIAKTMGEGDTKRSDELFSMIVYVSIACGILLTILGLLTLRPLASALGVEGRMLEDSVRYGRIVLLVLPAYILQYEFQCLFATAGKAKLGLYVTVAAGLTNMVLDALFVAVLPFGLEGAAAATALSQCAGGIIPLIYFARPNDSFLRLGKTALDGRSLGKICVNGSSERISNIQAIFIGYSVGVAPIISYQYGAQNHEELRSIRKKSLLLIGIFAIAMFGAAYGLSRPLSTLFVGYDTELLELTVHAFFIFSFSFLFSGFAIFGSSFFTALNDGPTSAAISFLRTLVFQVVAVVVLPLIWDVDGIWVSVTVAEIMAMLVTVFFLCVKQKKYQY